MKNYGFGEDQVQSSKGFPLSACVDGVTLESVDYVKDQMKDGTDYQAVDFVFTREDGGRLKDRMFEVNEEKVRPKGEQSVEDAIKAAYIRFNTRLWHIADAFYTDRDELKDACSNVKNFKELIKNFGKVVMEHAAGKDAFVKTVRNKGGYVNLPMFPKFIQPGDKACTLEYSEYELEQNKKNAKPATTVSSEDKAEAPIIEGEDDDDDWLDNV